MPRRSLGTLALLVMVVAPLAAGAEGAPFDQVNGGGQVVLSGTDLEAAGDTVAIQAQNTPNAPNKGNVEYIETSLAGEEGVARWHGTVTCLAVEGDTAQLGGTIQAQGSTRAGYFAIEATDNGQPSEGAGVDVIKITYPDEAPDCDEDFDDVDELTLARGNVRVHDAA